tara:strand:- start:75 stop:1745 length:1671 start_codon:yes stop_codon:yes gene_type:complete
MCVDKDTCLAHGYFLLGNAIVDASDREGLRSALFYGLCHYYVEAVKFGGMQFIGARINLALCYVVAGAVNKAKLVASKLFDDLGMGTPWLNSTSKIIPTALKRSTTSLLMYVPSSLQKYLKLLSQMLFTSIAPRWLDMVTPKDMQWEEDGMSELATLERYLIREYKMTSSTKFSSVLRPRVLVVVPSDPLQAYEKAGYGSWLQDYYNPMSFFHAVFVLTPAEVGPERALHGMWVIPISSTSNTTATFRSILLRVGASAVRAYGGYWPADMAVQGAKGTNIPVIVSVHDTNPKLLHVDSVSKANQIWPVSHAVAAVLMTTFNIPVRQIRMLSNRVDLNIFSLQKTMTTTRDQAVERAEKIGALAMRFPGKYRLLFVGRRNEQKNWDTVMRALYILGDEYVCIFIGRGPRAPLVQYAAEWNITSQVYLVDTVQSEDLRYYMWLSSTFVVPSRWEGFGIVFIEAMATGSIVITSNVAPMNEYIVHERSGLLLNNLENEKELAQLIGRGVHDTALRDKLQTNGPLAAARFSKEEIDRWECSLYRMVVGANGRTSFEQPIT